MVILGFARSADVLAAAAADPAAEAQAAELIAHGDTLFEARSPREGRLPFRAPPPLIRSRALSPQVLGGGTRIYAMPMDPPPRRGGAEGPAPPGGGGRGPSTMWQLSFAVDALADANALSASGAAALLAEARRCPPGFFFFFCSAR